MSESRTEPDAVRAASDQLYDALEELLNGDASAMAEIWSHEDELTTMTELGERDDPSEADY